MRFRVKGTKFIISAVFGTLAILFSVFITFYITPKIIASVGIDAYGFVSLSNSIISYLQIVTIALNAYAARYISIAYIKKKYDEFNIYFNTVLWGDIGIGISILGVFFGIVIFAEKLIRVPTHLVNDVQLLFIFVGLNYLIGLISVSWKVFAQISDRTDLLNFWESLSNVLQIFILLVAFNLYYPHIWYVGLAQLAASILVFILCVYFSKKYLPQLCIGINRFSKKYANILLLKGIWNSIDGLGNTLNSGLDLLITDLMLSAVDMGKVSVAKSIAALLTRLYTMISQIFNPKIINAYAEENYNKLIDIYKKAITICGLITNIIVSCFIFLGKDFINLWIPNQDVNTIFILVLISMIPCIIEGMTYPLYSIYTLTTKIKVTTVITIVSGFLNVVSMFFLLKYTNLGVYSIVITTAVIVSIAHLVTPFYSCKCLNISVFTFVPTMAKVLSELFICIFVMYFINSLLWTGLSWIAFFEKSLILSLTALMIGTLMLLVPIKASTF